MLFLQQFDVWSKIDYFFFAVLPYPIFLFCITTVDIPMYRIVQRKDRSADSSAEKQEEKRDVSSGRAVSTASTSSPSPAQQQQQPVRLASRQQQQKVTIEQRKSSPATAAAKGATNLLLVRAADGAAKSAAGSVAGPSTTAEAQVKPTSATSEKRQMDASIRLIDDEMELIDSFKEFLLENNTKFTVIGAVGAQGTGKSTILSMLAGNSTSDMFRQYIFRPAAREAVEACRYQTNKLSVYVSPTTRTIFLDCQPLDCAPLLEDLARTHHRGAKGGSALEAMELESLQLLLLMVNVCHTLLLCTDWFPDLSIVRRLMRVELFPAFFTQTAANGADARRKVNLVMIHQRAKQYPDLQPLMVHERMQQLSALFAGSSFCVEGGLTMTKLGFEIYEPACAELEANYVLLGELKPRTRMDANPNDQQSNRWQWDDYGAVMAQLRSKILQLPNSRSMNGKTETQWFAHLADTWRRLRDELPLLTDDGCTLKQKHQQLLASSGEHAAAATASLMMRVHSPRRRNRKAANSGGGGGGRHRQQRRDVIFTSRSGDKAQQKVIIERRKNEDEHAEEEAEGDGD